MNYIVKVLVIAIITSLSVLILKEKSNGFAFLLSFGSGICILLLSLSKVREIQGVFADCFNIEGSAGDGIDILFKAIIITVICSLIKDYLIDNGNRFLASVVDLCSKISVMVLAFPLIKTTITMITMLID